MNEYEKNIENAKADFDGFTASLENYRALPAIAEAFESNVTINEEDNVRSGFYIKTKSFGSEEMAKNFATKFKESLERERPTLKVVYVNRNKTDNHLEFFICSKVLV